MPLYCKQQLLLGLSKVTYSSEDKSREAFTFTLTAGDWHHVYCGTHDNAYSQMKRAAFRLFEEREGSIWTKAGASGDGIRWFTRCHYHDDEGRVALTFSEDVRDMLANLTWGGAYTPVYLKSVCALESTVHSAP